MNVRRQVAETIREYGLVGQGDTLVLGVSGGPDSLCLLHVLLRLRDGLDLRVHVAHLHHGARGQDADADADFVARVAAEWQVPCAIGREDVPAVARAHGLAFEEAARRCRYAFLARVAHEARARLIAVAHTSDDQAETVLMHLLRGSGLAGLRGMLPATPVTDYRLLQPLGAQPPPEPVVGVTIVRPLLEVTRAEVERYCAENSLQPRFDRSNLDTTRFRNRLRHELLPLLETYNPRIRARLCHTAALVASDYELVCGVREEAWSRLVREENAERVVLDRNAWRAVPIALQRATLRQAVHRLRPMLRDVSFVHVEDARQVALSGATGAQATLPAGLRLSVDYDALVVGERDDHGQPPAEPLMCDREPLTVRVPGVTPLPHTEWALDASVLPSWDAQSVAQNADRWTAYLDLDRLAGPLVLRSRQPADRFRPQGMEQHRVSLGSFLINRKVRQHWRERVPLLVAGNEIAWVCGHRIAEEARVSPQTRRVLALRFARIPIGDRQVAGSEVT